MLKSRIRYLFHNQLNTTTHICVISEFPMQFIAGLICGFIFGVIVTNVYFIFATGLATISGQADDYANRIQGEE